MSLQGSDVLQLAFAGLLATVLFGGAYLLPKRIAVSLLIALIPFQAIDTRYATSNTVLLCVVFLAIVIREKDIRLPMLPQSIFMIFAYLISMALAHPATYTLHALYVFNFGAALLMFWLTYNYALRVASWDEAIRPFLIMNVLVIAYCIVQLVEGPGRSFSLFGIRELTMLEAREDYRLSGPFGAPGLTAEYLVVMIFILVYRILFTHRKRVRNALIAILGADLLLLVTTGNRGGFLTLLGASILFLTLFRRFLGTGRTLGIAVGLCLLLSLAAAIAVNFTDYGSLFDRLSATEIDAEGIPDTRQRTWPAAWHEIQQQPFFGHGPRLYFPDQDAGVRYEGHVAILYPHNLYLFLLFTVGIVGLVPFLILLVTPLVRCWRLSTRSVEQSDTWFLKTGFIIMIAILVDQIKVEFMRYNQTDYWHFIFALMGLLIAACDRVAFAATANPVNRHGNTI